jgi:hypothetical protein
LFPTDGKLANNECWRPSLPRLTQPLQVQVVEGLELLGVLLKEADALDLIRSERPI